MPKQATEANPLVEALGLAVDRKALEYLLELGNEVLERAEAIKSRHPEGTFDDMEGLSDEGDRGGSTPEPAKAPKKKVGRPKKVVFQSTGLTAHMRKWAEAHDGVLDIIAYKDSNPQFKRNSVDGVFYGLVRKGEFTPRDKNGLAHAAKA